MNEDEAKAAITAILHPFLNTGTFEAPGWAIKTYLAMHSEDTLARIADAVGIE